MFTEVMAGFDVLFDIAGIEDLMLFTLILNYAPTLLLLGGIAGAGLAYYKGYGQVSSTDVNGMIRMVFAALGLVLFVTMFGNIATSFVDLYTAYSADPNYPIFDLAVSIAPTILFLGGIAAFVGTGIGGLKASRKKGKQSPPS
jgi:hypothetical protein